MNPSINQSFFSRQPLTTSRFLPNERDRQTILIFGKILKTRELNPMVQLIADRRDVDFVLHEQIGQVDHEIFAEFNKKTVDLIVSEARNLALKEILPTFKEGDEQGCTLENGRVTVPESFKRAWRLFCEGEWLAMCDDPEVGGQGMPRTVGTAALEYMVGANSALHEKDVFRRMGRHHAAHRTGSRLRRGGLDHHRGKKSRWHLFPQRGQDFHLRRGA
jgi:hypothetical protein